MFAAITPFFVFHFMPWSSHFATSSNVSEYNFVFRRFDGNRTLCSIIQRRSEFNGVPRNLHFAEFKKVERYWMEMLLSWTYPFTLIPWGVSEHLFVSVVPGWTFDVVATRIRPNWWGLPCSCKRVPGVLLYISSFHWRRANLSHQCCENRSYSGWTRLHTGCSLGFLPQVSCNF